MASEMDFNFSLKMVVSTGFPVQFYSTLTFSRVFGTPSPLQAVPIKETPFAFQIERKLQLK